MKPLLSKERVEQGASFKLMNTSKFVMRNEAGLSDVEDIYIEVGHGMS